MKTLFIVTYEWKLEGENETYNGSTVNVVANDAMTAIKAAIEECRNGFVEPLADVRLAQVERGKTIDLIV